MSECAFATLDVFCDRPFAGNPLAVVNDADDLDDTTMLAVAREFGFSETVFVCTANAGGDVAVRIFTPGGELPFAGHPTVGAAVWLADTGRVARDDDRGQVVLEEKAGLVPVDVRWVDGGITATLVTPAPPVAEPSGLDPAAVAPLLGLEPADIVDPPEFVSAGTPFLAVAVATRDALARIVVDTGGWLDLADSDPRRGSIYVYAAGDSVHARMFGPGVGIVEDPATGSAAGALTAILAAGRPDGTHRWTLHQGDDMGRPSVIDVEADVAGGAVARARVGGSAVVVTRGRLDLGAELGRPPASSYAS